MTNKNMCIEVKSRPKPFLLTPSGKDYLWGGRRLKDDFNKELDMTLLAETWECSTHPDGPSMIASGEFVGNSLAQLIKEHPEFLGTHPKTEDGLPILVKLIDAKQNLSVQVHPDDAYANRYENGQMGKSELWYVLDADPGAAVIYGLCHDVSEKKLRQSIVDGTIEKYLQKIPAKKDDLFYIPAGTVHAIGAGVLIAEIQESSNLTYRLYDYDRVDRNGHKRELHIDKVLQVANLGISIEPRQPLRVLKYRRGCAYEFLCRCKYFEVYRMLINTECCRDFVEYRSDGTSFRVLLCMDGCGSVQMMDGDFLPFFKGDCIFFPANSMSVKIHGKAQFLEVCA